MLRRRHEAQGSQAASVLGLIDVVFENARVYTGDPEQPVARSIAVRGGRIVAIGDRAAVRRRVGARTDRIDCRGRAVLPGIVDPHLHLLGMATRHAKLDCAAAPSRVALLEAVRGWARGLARDEWLRGEGLDESAPGGVPTAAALERVAPGRLVRLRHRSGHASVLSVAGLGRLRDVAPELARRAMAQGGLVSGHEDLLAELVGPLDTAMVVAGLRRVGGELASRGVTMVADATPRHRRDLAPIEQAGLPQRIVAMRPWNGRRWRGGSRIVAGPVKLLVDEVGASLRPPPAVLMARIVAAARAGNAVAVHVVGTSTLVTVLEAFARLPAGRRAARHRIEHLAECPPPLLAPLGALGVAVVTNPAFVYWRGDVYRTETPTAAHAWLYRTRSLLRAGVRVAAASDAPVVPADPWLGIAAARTRRTRTGRALGVGERVDAATAVDLHTAAAAWVLGDDRRGRLRVGAPADLIVVEPDPFHASPDEVRTTRVCLTVADGRVVWPG